MYEFVSGRVGGSTLANSTGAAWSQSNITLPELVGMGMGTYDGGANSMGGGTSSGYGGIHHGTFADQIKANFQANMAEGLTTLIVTPIAFKVISKLAAKPRREFNKLAKTVGLPISM